MKEWIMFALVLIMLALMAYLFSGCFRTEIESGWSMVDFEEIDKQILIDLIPKGECLGGTMPEIKRCIWYCNK